MSLARPHANTSSLFIIFSVSSLFRHAVIKCLDLFSFSSSKVLNEILEPPGWMLRVMCVSKRECEIRGRQKETHVEYILL